MALPTRTKRANGTVWVFLSWLSLALILVMMGVLGVLILSNSFHALWPAAIEQVRLADGTTFLGSLTNSDVSPDGLTRLQYKVGNREMHGGADFRWVFEKDIVLRERPENALIIQRMENGDFLGFPESADAVRLNEQLRSFAAQNAASAKPLSRHLTALGNEWQQVHFALLKAGYDGDQKALDTLHQREIAIKAESEQVMAELNAVKQELAKQTASFITASGNTIVVPFSSILAVTNPNAMTIWQKLWKFGANIVDLLTQYPREANTEGGIFPAIFGTVMLVFLMAISAFPLGVAAGIYLREYARDNFFSRLARVAVNNLAGVPSIVYGMFGLGFFIYGMGGTIDSILYPERVAAGISTYGGGGILWSAMTLGLLTLPVVIVATEEALATVPSEVRQGSLALGATRFQTLWRVILPMASPGILTGFILAMARAAGEVAPLMLTGAVKSAHSLPFDGSWPLVHLERKFMHLGFHIYDMGFQSPNVEASKPLVYLTALVLLVLVFVLNIAAISVRKRMREKYAMKGF